MSCSSHDYSLNRLRRFNFQYSIIDRKKGLYLVEPYVFCPKSGRFWHTETGAEGAGVYRLITRLRKHHKKMLSNYPAGQENIDDTIEEPVDQDYEHSYIEESND